MRGATLLLAASLLLPCGSVCAGPDAALTEEIARLAAELGDKDFRKREAASRRLAEIGPPAAEALMAAADGSDEEAAHRARKLLDRLGLASPRTRERAEALTKAILDAPTPRECERAIRELDAMGGGGRRALQKLFPAGPAGTAAPGEVAFSAEARSRTVRRGDPVAFKAIMTNRGKRPLWVRPSCLSAGTFGPQDLGAPRPPDPEAEGRRQAAEVAREIAEMQMARAFDLVCLKPGASCEAELTLPGDQTELVGQVELTIRYDAGPGQAVLVLPSGEKREGEDDREPFQASPATFMAIESGGVLRVLPKLEIDPDAPARLAVSAGAASPDGSIPVEAEAKAEADLELSSDGQGGFPTGFWGALLDAKGEAAWIGPLGAAKAAKGHSLKKGESLRWKGSIRPEGIPPGDYAFHVGFSGLPKGAWSGELVAASVKVTIGGGPPRGKTAATLRGKLGAFKGQMPLVDPEGRWDQEWLTLDEKEAPSVIALFQKKRPDSGRLVEVKGEVSEIDLGGEPGTKRSFRSRVILVQEWRYLDGKK